MFKEMQNNSNQNAVNGVDQGYCLDFNPTHKWVGYSNLSIIKSLSNSSAVYDKKGRIIEIYPNRLVDYARYNRCSQLSSNSPAVYGWGITITHPKSIGMAFTPLQELHGNWETSRVKSQTESHKC